VNLTKQLYDKICQGKERRRILVAGDVMIDRWVHGYTDCCQDDCIKFVTEYTEDTPGGAANAARSINNWGVEVSLFGYEGDDRPIKCRYVRDGKIVFRADGNELLPSQACIRGDRYQWSRDLALEMLPYASGVLLSDYDKGYLTPEFIAAVVTECKRRGIPCVADCKRAPELYAGCILKGNFEWFDKYINVMDSPPPNSLTITNGPADPATWVKGAKSGFAGGNVLPLVTCINHVGAGDCFAAHLALALAYRYSLKDAAAVAHSAGRVYVQHPHNRPPLPTEVAADMALAFAQRETISTSTP